MKSPVLLLVLALALAAACRSSSPGAVEARSLLGPELRRPEIPEDRRAELEANLAAARAAWKADPSEENWIWVGRRLAYLARYGEAVDWYTQGLAKFPQSHRLLRHRGHRYITLRRFDSATADLRRAAALAAGVPDEWEPDGAPNRYGVPRSTLQSNIYYHLGLAHYLGGRYEAALAAYERCLDYCTESADMWVATAHWKYMTLRRLGRHEAARALVAGVQPDMGVIENFDYLHLLSMYAGRLEPSKLVRDLAGEGVADATVLYGVANWSLANGNTDRARRLLQVAVDGTAWAAFGHIAGEFDLARMHL